MRKNVFDKDCLRSKHHIGNDAVLVAADVENDIAAHPIHCVEYRLQRRKIGCLGMFERGVPMKQCIDGTRVDRPEFTQPPLGDDVHKFNYCKIRYKLQFAIFDVAYIWQSVGPHCT